MDAVDPKAKKGGGTVPTKDTTEEQSVEIDSNPENDDELDVGEIKSEFSGEDQINVEKSFPFKQITNDIYPMDSSVRIGLKTR